MLPPLRKKTPEERAVARLPEGEDLTFTLFGERAIIGDGATGAMSEGTEWQWQNEPPPEDDQAKALHDLALAIQEQTKSLEALTQGDTDDLERLLQETKALTYGRPVQNPEEQPGSDSEADEEEEILYP